MFNSLPDPLSGAQLEAARTPIVDGYLRYPAWKWSTISYPQAAQPVGAPLLFFQGAETAPADKTLTNVPTTSQFVPGGQKYHARKLFMELIQELTNDADAAPSAAGIIRDADRITKTNRGFLQYTVPSIAKTYDPIPLTVFGEPGAIIPDFGGNNQASAASKSALNQHVRLGPIGGFPIDVVIYENEGFPVNLTWGVQTAISAATLIRVLTYGWNYVKVG